MNQTNNYVIPKIKVFQSFKEASSELESYGYLKLDEGVDRKLEDCFIFPRTFVIAEAGYGKTRLLKELVLKARSNGKSSVYLDLKKILISETLEDHIKLQISILKLESFEITNHDGSFLCLDALDEVNQGDFSATVEKIKTFAAKNPKITIIVACRWHFFQKYQELFIDTDFRYVHISPFSIDEVRSYLKQSSISEEDIDKLIDSLHFKHRNLIIQTPRYLELLVDYIKKKGIKDISSLTRTNLLEYFIYKKLELEDKNLNTQKRDLIKRVLEKLALILEIYQTNILTKDELMTFFDDLKSDLKVSLLQQIPLEVLYDKTVLKDNTNTIEFDNTEFQEYLAAKEIKRLGHPSQTVFDLSVDPELREIYPSWFNTLTFLIELDITLLKPILDFTNHKREGYVQDEGYHRFITRVNLYQLPKEDQKTIFEQTFNYYQTILHWIDWDIARNLASYFDISQHSLLKNYLNKTRFSSDTERFVQLGNLVQTVGFLIERGVFNQIDKNFWKRKLLKLAKDKNINGVLQRHALFALENFKDDSVIDTVADVWDHNDELVRDRFLELCGTVNPNHDTSIKFFVEGTKRHSITARHGLYSISHSQAVNNLLQYFIDDELFFSQFLDQESIFKEKDKQIIEHIKLVWNEGIKNKLELITQKAFESDFWYHAEKSDFIKDIALLLKEKDKVYIFKLLNQAGTSDRLNKNLFSLQHLFAFILDKDQVKKFTDQLAKFEHGQRVALWTLQQIKFSKRPNAGDIYEEGRKYLPKEYKESEEYWKKQDNKLPEEDRLYKDFQQKLEPSRGKFMRDVFDFYVNNSEKIDQRITVDEGKRLIDLVVGSVFEKLDPAKQKLTITNKSEGGKTYTTHGWISIFGSCLEVAEKLHPDISRFRAKIISYIPFSYHNHLKAIFELVKDITPAETKNLLKVYTEKKSDLWQHMPDSFIEAVKKYSIKEAVPILREFVRLKSFSVYERTSALEVAEYLDPNEKILNAVFKNYSKSEKELSEKANKLLIEKHKDKKAIDWLFKQITDRAFKFSESKGVHSVGEQENELHEKSFASPLASLKDPKFQKQFLGLLGYSFKLLKRDRLYYSYGQYIWQIVYSYFDNLKEEKSYKPLKALEDYLHKHSTEEGANWFAGKVKELRRSYMNFLSKPKNIAECILIYNNFKARQYLKIATPRELLEKIKEVIEKEVKNWVIGEGSKLLKSTETDVQKQIQTQLENGFLRKGFRPQEIIVIREPQSQDDKRTDFLLFYGFIGPIIIEVKLSRSSELIGRLNTKKSYKSLQHYMNNYKAYFGIFLVVDNKQRKKKVDSWQAQFKRIKEAYEQIENVEVVNIFGGVSD